MQENRIAKELKTPIVPWYEQAQKVANNNDNSKLYIFLLLKYIFKYLTDKVLNKIDKHIIPVNSENMKSSIMNGLYINAVDMMELKTRLFICLDNILFNIILEQNNVIIEIISDIVFMLLSVKLRNKQIFKNMNIKTLPLIKYQDAFELISLANV